MSDTAESPPRPGGAPPRGRALLLNCTTPSRCGGSSLSSGFCSSSSDSCVPRGRLPPPNSVSGTARLNLNEKMSPLEAR